MPPHIRSVPLYLVGWLRTQFSKSFPQLQQDLLTSRRTIESQERQILSLEAALAQRPLLPNDAPESDKDRLIADLNRTVCELEIVTRGYEENLGAPLRQVREDVEKEWIAKVQEKERQLEEKEAFIAECQRALEKEKQVNQLCSCPHSRLSVCFSGPAETRGRENRACVICA
jgi:centromeric protein E